MGKTATRGRGRAAKAKSRGKAQARSGGALSWAIIGVLAISGIAAYDNWKKIQPVLARLPAGESHAAVQTKPVANREPSAPKQVAAVQPAAKPVAPATMPVPPASIPTPAAQPARIEPASISPTAAQTGSAAFGYCGQGTHVNCVADGGTFWYKGEKIVIADMVSPDVEAARCDGERRVAFAAKSRLLTLLNAGPFTMNAAGKPDPSGAPRVVSRDGRSFGVQLINEGLARKPGAGAAAWCA